MSNEAPPPMAPLYTKIIAIVALMFIIAGAVIMEVAKPTYNSCGDNCYSSIRNSVYYSCLKRCYNTYKALKNGGIAILVIGLLAFVGDGVYTYIFLSQQ
jgi:hypothetical protein